MFGLSPQTKGRLLIATPPLEDPNFDRTVVFVLEHHSDGAIGLILNRPTMLPLVEPLDRWADLQSSPAVIFTGGPVDSNAMIGLAIAKQPVADDVEHLTVISNPISSVDLSADPAIVGASIDTVRVFRGYAGWGSGQLEHEIGQGAWLVVDSDLDDVFSDEPDELWWSVLRRQPGRLSWLALAPDDLSFN